VIVEVDSIGRAAWLRAKTDFAVTWSQPLWPIFKNSSAKQYYKDFGDNYNMQVIIDSWEHGFPIITKVKFKNEQSYTWFVLTWS
jgi:hypothetical protein